MHARAEDLLKLRDLPELAPPPRVWGRVLEGIGARAAARRFRRRSALAAAVFAALAAVPLTYVATRDAAPPSFTIAALHPARATWDEAAYAPLIAESARLERLLAEMPAPRLVLGSTAGTIVGLEDRIAYVDAQLSYAAARDLAPPYRRALWDERVELMNALVYVRLAQMQGF